MARWNPANHPRYPNGRFRPKLSQSIRVSPISVSYNAGVRVPVVPGRASLYLGALARVERTGGNGLFQAQIDRGVNAAFGKIGDPHGRSNVAQLLKGNEINAKGLRIRGPNNLVNAPTFRVSRNSATTAKHEVVRRRPARRRARAVPITQPGIATAKPKALPRGRRPSRRTARSSTAGTRVRR